MSITAHGITRPGGATRRRVPPRAAVALLALMSLGLALAALSACGDEPAEKAPAAPATARDALVAYLGMLERGQFGDLDRVATPRYVSNHTGGADTPLDEARLIDLTLQPEDGGERTQARLTVYVDPGPGKGAWGDEAGERVLFAYLVQSDDGGWLIDDFGTGP